MNKFVTCLTPTNNDKTVISNSSVHKIKQYTNVVTLNTGGQPNKCCIKEENQLKVQFFDLVKMTRTSHNTSFIETSQDLG